MTGYGKVGLNVGSVGRWTRFGLGLITVAYVLSDFYPSTHSHSANFFLLMILSFISIVGIYTFGHVFLGSRLSGKSAWWGTLLFVVPAMFLIVGHQTYLRRWLMCEPIQGRIDNYHHGSSVQGFPDTV